MLLSQRCEVYRIVRGSQFGPAGVSLWTTFEEIGAAKMRTLTLVEPHARTFGLQRPSGRLGYFFENLQPLPARQPLTASQVHQRLVLPDQPFLSHSPSATQRRV